MKIKNKINFIMLWVLGMASVSAFADSDEIQIEYPMPSINDVRITNYTVNGHATPCSGSVIAPKGPNEVDLSPIPPSPWQGTMQLLPTYNICYPDVSVQQMQTAIPQPYDPGTNSIAFSAGGQPVFSMTNLSANNWKGQYFWYTGSDGKQHQYYFVGCSPGGTTQIFCCFGYGSGACEGFR